MRPVRNLARCRHYLHQRQSGLLFRLDSGYVLHCFQKKSPSGIRTAKTDVELIHERLKTAHADYEARYGKHD